MLQDLIVKSRKKFENLKRKVNIGAESSPFIPKDLELYLNRNVDGTFDIKVQISFLLEGDGIAGAVPLGLFKLEDQIHIHDWNITKDEEGKTSAFFLPPINQAPGVTTSIYKALPSDSEHYNKLVMPVNNKGYITRTEKNIPPIDIKHSKFFNIIAAALTQHDLDFESLSNIKEIKSIAADLKPETVVLEEPLVLPVYSGNSNTYFEFTGEVTFMVAHDIILYAPNIINEESFNDLFNTEEVNNPENTSA